MKYFRKKMLASKTSALVVFLMFGLCAAARAQTCQPVAPDLVSWWAADGFGYDYRSRNFLEHLNEAGYDQGLNAEAFLLDGTDDALTPLDSSPYNLQSITIEAWIYKQANTGGAIEDIFTKWGGAAERDSFLLGTYFDGRGLRLFGAIGDGASGDIGISGGGIRLGVWTHVAMTYRETDGLNKLYVNGSEVARRYRPGGIFRSDSKVYFGREDSTNPRFFRGLIDELAIYRRALTEREIKAVYNARSAGKCKQTATFQPDGIASFWSGDAHTNDIAGGNNITIINGVDYKVGKVGQGLNFDGVSGYAVVPHNNNQTISDGFSVEAWVYVRSLKSRAYIFSKGSDPKNNWQMYLDYDNGKPRLYVEINSPTGNSRTLLSWNMVFNLNQWNHVAFTFGREGAPTERDFKLFRMYINGLWALVPNPTPADMPVNPSDALFIGTSQTSPTYFDGIIDDAAIYQRQLSETEVRMIYSVGRAGKLKTVQTPIGSNISMSIGDATLYLPQVTESGTTQVIPLDPSLFPALPPNRSHSGLFYDVSTGAVFSGYPTVCFDVPALQNQFPDLRLLQFENGSWIDVTAPSNTFPRLCSTQIRSLSPLAIALS